MFCARSRTSQDDASCLYVAHQSWAAVYEHLPDIIMCTTDVMANATPASIPRFPNCLVLSPQPVDQACAFIQPHTLRPTRTPTCFQATSYLDCSTQCLAGFVHHAQSATAEETDA